MEYRSAPQKGCASALAFAIVPDRSRALGFIRGVVRFVQRLSCQRRYAIIIIRQLEQFGPNVLSRLVRC